MTSPWQKLEQLSLSLNREKVILITQMTKKHAVTLIFQAGRQGLETQVLTSAWQAFPPVLKTYSSPSSSLLWSGTSSSQAPALPSPSPSPRAALPCRSVGVTRTLVELQQPLPGEHAAVPGQQGEEMATQPHLGF